ncbi:MAG: hypothetical protein HY824_12445, partial [Acidobacteria bacterium]|nr:hypothetical protein [Acidobacteriota bacterium]
VVSTAVPQQAAFYPAVPSGTLIPTRSLGFDVGAHVYVLRLGPSRVGVGLELLRATGKTTVPTPVPPPGGASATPPAPQTRPDVTVTVRALAPQVSFNFGSADGWSYVSAGIGRAGVQATTSAFGSGSGTTAATTPEGTLESGALRSINFGGGARWFTNRHVAFSFDIRFHKVAGGGPVEVPATTLLAASAGMSFR